jgi:hypothetical protein
MTGCCLASVDDNVVFLNQPSLRYISRWITSQQWCCWCGGETKTYFQLFLGCNAVLIGGSLPASWSKPFGHVSVASTVCDLETICIYFIWEKYIQSECVRYSVEYNRRVNVTCFLKNLLFCWPCIVIHQYSKTNEMHFLYSCCYELTASTCFEHYLLIFRRRCTNNTWYIACVLCLLAAPTRMQPTDITRTQYTDCWLCSVSWRWASSAGDRQRPLIHNKMNTKNASCWFYDTGVFL